MKSLESCRARTAAAEPCFVRLPVRCRRRHQNPATKNRVAQTGPGRSQRSRPLSVARKSSLLPAGLAALCRYPPPLKQAPLRAPPPTLQNLPDPRQADFASACAHSRAGSPFRRWSAQCREDPRGKCSPVASRSRLDLRTGIARNGRERWQNPGAIARHPASRDR